MPLFCWLFLVNMAFKRTISGDGVVGDPVAVLNWILNHVIPFWRKAIAIRIEMSSSGQKGEEYSLETASYLSVKVRNHEVFPHQTRQDSPEDEVSKFYNVGCIHFVRDALVIFHFYTIIFFSMK